MVRIITLTTLMASVLTITAHAQIVSNPVLTTWTPAVTATTTAYRPVPVAATCPVPVAAPVTNACRPCTVAPAQYAPTLGYAPATTYRAPVTAGYAPVVSRPVPVVPRATYYAPATPNRVVYRQPIVVGPRPITRPYTPPLRSPAVTAYSPVRAYYVPAPTRATPPAAYQPAYQPAVRGYRRATTTYQPIPRSYPPAPTAPNAGCACGR